MNIIETALTQCMRTVCICIWIQGRIYRRVLQIMRLILPPGYIVLNKQLAYVCMDMLSRPGTHLI